MTSISGGLIRKFNETDRDSREYIAGLQKIIAVALTVGRALANVYVASSSIVSAVIEAAAKLSQNMRSLLLTRLISGLPPIFELEGAEVGEELVSSLRSLKFSISWRIAPLTEVVAGVLRKLRKEARELSVAGVLRRPLVVQPPLTFETMGIISDYADRISGISERAHDTTSAVTTRVSVDYGRKIPQPIAERVAEAYGVRVLGVVSPPIRALSERMAEAYGVGVPIARAPPAVEAAGVVREVSKFISEAPALTFPVPEEITRRYVLEIPELGRVPRPIAERVGEAYRVKVLGAMSPFAEAVSEKVAEAPSVEVLGVLGRYPAAEAVGRVVRYAPMIADMGALGYGLVRRGAAELYAVKPFGVRPPVETIIVERLLGRRRRVSEIVSRKVAEVYRAGAPIARAPPILETARVISDHVDRVSGIVRRGAAEAYGLRALVAMPPAAEAVEAIREVSRFVGEVPAPVSPAVAITRRYVLEIPELRVPQPITERVGEAYRVKVLSTVSPPIKALGERMAEAYGVGVPIARAPPAVEAAGVVREVSGVMGRAPVPTLPAVEVARRGRHVLTIPEIKKVFRLITEVVAKAYRIEVLSLIPPPVEAVAERVAEAPGVGIPEAPPAYPAAEAMGAARVLSSAVSRLKREISGVMRERYLGLVAGAPPVREYLAMGTIFREISEVGKGFELVGRRVREVSRGVPSVVRPLSAVEAVRAVSSYVSVMSEMSQVFDVLGAISREAVASGLEARRVLVEGVSRVGLEGIVRGVAGEVVAKPLRADVGRYGLERVSLGLPGVVQAVKLHEIIPILYSLAPQAAPRERQTVINNTFNITITPRALEDESDLRSLGRKISRILEREMRRYGVST